MISAVDSSVILDILTASPAHFESSRSLFRRGRDEGKLIVCPLVWGELRPFFKERGELELVMEKMSIVFDDLGKEVSEMAGEIWSEYRKAKGSRSRLLPDFLIGAHAMLKANRLITRDRGFYKSYFRKLTILDPTTR